MIFKKTNITKSIVFGFVMILSTQVVNAMTDDDKGKNGHITCIDDDGADVIMTRGRKTSASRHSLDTKLVFDNKEGNAFVASLEEQIAKHGNSEEMIARYVQAIKDQGIDVGNIPCHIFQRAVYVPSARRPLHAVVDKNSPTMVRIILEAGAKFNIDDKDHDSKTALFNAVCEGFEDVAIILIDAEANLTEVYPGGWNILHLAMARGLNKVVRKVFGKLQKSNPSKLQELLDQKNEHKVTPSACVNNMNRAYYPHADFDGVVAALSGLKLD